MAAASEELGNATILGGSINPLQVYMGQQAARQKQEALKAEQAKKDRDALHDYMDKYKPEAKWEPIKKEIVGMANEIRDKTYAALDAGKPIGVVERDAKRAHGLLEEYMAETDAWQKDYEAANKIWDDNVKAGLYNKDKHPLRDVLYNNDGSLKSINERRAGMNQLQDIVGHPKNYNKEGVYKDFAKGLTAQVNDKYAQLASGLGETYNNEHTKTKIGLQRDANGNLVMDLRTGEYQLSPTDDALIAANEHPMMKGLMDLELGANPSIPKQREWLAKVMKPYDETEVKNTISHGFKYNQEDNPKNIKWGINFGHKVDDLEARRDIVQKMASGTRPDVLASIGNVVKGPSAQYVDGGKKIRITYKANLADPNFDPNNLESLKSAYIKNTYNKGKQEVTSDIDISTPEAQNAAEYALSEILDSQNAKTSIGADRFHRYKEAHEKNNPNPTSNKSIAEQMKEAANKK